VLADVCVCVCVGCCCCTHRCALLACLSWQVLETRVRVRVCASFERACACLSVNVRACEVLRVFACLLRFCSHVCTHEDVLDAMRVRV
jgi:hypothetical protein